MSAAIVPATFATYRSLVDGTLAIVIHVEPRYRRLALDILDEPGAPLAVARLTNDAALAADQTDTPSPLPGASQEAGPGAAMASSPGSASTSKRKRSLAEHVAMTCQEQSFREFVAGWRGDAAQVVRELCRVESRAEIVPGSDAAERWGDLEAAYHRHLSDLKVRTVHA